jgi:hypothetical protein
MKKKRKGNIWRNRKRTKEKLDKKEKMEKSLRRRRRRRRRERGNCGAGELLPDTNMDGGVVSSSSTNSNIANLSKNINFIFILIRTSVFGGTYKPAMLGHKCHFNVKFLSVPCRVWDGK